MKQVVIYQRKSKVKKTQRFLGSIFISLSLAGVALFLSPFLAPLFIKNKPVIMQTSGFGTLIDQVVAPSNRFINTPVSVDSFYLTIDKIGVHNASISPQVKTDVKTNYNEALTRGLVQAEGTAFPGEGSLIYLYGHSTNYPWLIKDFNALLWRLDELKFGDKIKLTFNGVDYSYFVFDKKIVAPEEIELIKEKLNQDILVLQTCWPRGTTLKRLLIFCQPSKFGSLI